MTGNTAARVPVIGLTGGSGSGKTEAARMLAELGAAVVDADAISRRVTEDAAVLAELAVELGDWVVGADGRFDRAAVAARAFGDRDFLARLTALTHKYIIEEIYRAVAGLRTAGEHAAIVIDAPIPVEKGFLDLADTVWVVCAGRAARLARIVGRDGIGADAAGARLDAQLPDGRYLAIADLVIGNDGSLAELREAITHNYKRLFTNH